MDKYLMVWKFRNAAYWLYAIVHWFCNKGKIHGRTLGIRARANCILC